MAPSITPNPKQVLFWDTNSAPVGPNTNITWDAGKDTGYVARLDQPGITQEARFDPLDPTEFRSTGSKLDTIEYGHEITYSLYQTDKKTTKGRKLAEATVTTADAVQTYVNEMAQSAVVAGNVPQAIFNINIVPGIDTVRISFRTSQPTVPEVNITLEDGTQVAASFPLFGGLALSHQVILGENTPLAQDTLHTVTITAPAHLPSVVPSVFTTKFKTGRRDATVHFNTLTVRKDGDPDGPGELSFLFYTGDADTFMGDFGIFPKDWRSLSDGDIVSLSDLGPFQLDHVGRRIGVGIKGVDDDSVASGDPGLELLGEEPVFPFGGDTWDNRTGSVDSSSVLSVGDFDEAWVTAVYDVSDVIGSSTFPFEAATGDYGVAFTVDGSITVNTQAPPPLDFRFQIFTLQPPRPNLGTAFALTMLGSNGALGGKNKKKHHLFGLGAEGTLYYKSFSATERVPRNQGWTKIPGVVTPPVTGVVGADDELHFFALDKDGAVVHRQAANVQHKGSWQTLGGRFQGPVVVAAAEGNAFDVFGLSAEGVVSHCTLNESNKKKSDWERIGADVAGALTALPQPDGDVAVFALGRDGQILHKRRSGHAWHPAGTQWQPIGKAPDSHLIARRIEDGGMALATFGNDGSFNVLLWRNYPQGDPLKGWRSQGTLVSWLDRQPPRLANKAPRRKSPGVPVSLNLRKAPSVTPQSVKAAATT